MLLLYGCREIKMRKLILGISLVSAFIFGAHEANAQCDCIGGSRENNYRGSKYSTPYEEFQNSEAVFIGECVEMKKIKRPPAFKSDFPYEYEIKFRVKKAWKKDLDELISLRYWAGCFIGFKEREEYLVYAFVHKGRLRTNYCSRTRLLSTATVDLKAFEESGQKPRNIIKALSLNP
jgi:hypothetical protein